jgi:phosphoglycolate phosphatase
MKNSSTLIIFGFDGTLADSFGWFVAHFNLAAKKFGFRTVSKDEIKEFRRLDARALRTRLKVPFWKLPFIANYMRRLMAADIRHIRPFPGIKKALRNLSRRHTLALVTSNSLKNVHDVLGPDTLALFKQAECGVGMFGKLSKLRAAARKCGFEPGQAFYVGDEIRDLAATRGIGMPFGAVGWGYCPLDALSAHRPDMIFRRVEDLNKLMKI